jgi:hypothetical protein
VCVRVHYLQHWAFKGLRQRQFLAAADNRMDLDEEVNSTTATCFTVLADNRYGPQLFEYRNSLAGLFHVLQKYPDTW